MVNFDGWFIEGTNKYCIKLLFGHCKIASEHGNTVDGQNPAPRKDDDYPAIIL